MTIKLTQTELEEIASLATSRNTKNPGVRGRDLGVSHTDTHYLGVFTEYAVAKAFNLSMNKELYPDGGDKHKPDLVVPNLGNIEVKAVTEKYSHDPWLKIEVATFNPDIDYYVLVTTDMANGIAEIRGYATKDQVMKAPQRRTRAHFPLNYELRVTELQDFQELLTGEVIVHPVIESNSKIIYEVPMTSAIKYNVGDLVKFSTGEGPTLTVTDVKETIATCVYYHSEQGFLTQEFPISLLNKVD